jgi:hypothetical protein
LTLQGRAIRQASIRFGDGRTLPFTPCKKGYIPVVVRPSDIDKRSTTTTPADVKFMYACPLHDKARRQRVSSEGGKFRVGEVNLNEMWSLSEKKNKEVKPTPSRAVSFNQKKETGQKNRAASPM